MKQVSLYEAKTHLSNLVEEASAGAEIVITKNGKPKARLIPIAPANREPRKLGQWAEQNKHVDWDRWDREFKAADKEVERLFNEGDVPSALDDMASKQKKSRVKGLADAPVAYEPRRKGRRRK